MDSCANRLRYALKIRNMRQSDLAAKTDIPKSAISQYCSGAFKPKQRRLFQIAKALDVDEAWLMGLDVPMERKEISLNPSKKAQKPTFVSEDGLSEAEQSLLHFFRQVPEKDQAMITQMIEAALKSQGLL